MAIVKKMSVMDIMRAGFDRIPPSESNGSGWPPSGNLMMGRMMGNRFRTRHEALFLGKLLLPPPATRQMTDILDKQKSGIFFAFSI